MKKLLLILVVILTALGVSACQAPKEQTNELETYDYYLLIVVSRQNLSQWKYSYVLREASSSDNFTYESDQLWSVGEFVLAIELDEEGNVYYTSLDATHQPSDEQYTLQIIDDFELALELQQYYYQENITSHSFGDWLQINYPDLYQRIESYF